MFLMYPRKLCKKSKDLVINATSLLCGDEIYDETFNCSSSFFLSFS